MPPLLPPLPPLFKPRSRLATIAPAASPIRPSDYPQIRDRAVAALQTLVRIPTVSRVVAAEEDAIVFEQFLDTLREQFPLLHDRLERTQITDHGLLFRWPGTQSDQPVVLMAHLDVVPVDEDSTWQHPAFGADLIDGAIWGRGTLDDKGSLVAICLAVERLLECGFTPNQDVWLSFGCDEEVMGVAAPAAVSELTQRGVRPWLVLDEGGAIAHQAFPGVRPPVAVIGVAEKGTTTIELRVDGRGGHSSTPERMGPTARIGRAIWRVEKNPFPPSLPEPTRELFRRLAPHAPAPLRPLMARVDRLASTLTRALIAAGPETAALTRTTAVTTTMSGSPAHNVLATTARAGVNARIAIDDSVAGVLAHLNHAINDKRVQMRVVDGGEPSPASPFDDEAFGLLERLVGEVFPDAICSPYVMMGATDSRHFTSICERVYRFTPFRMTKAQREAIHSFDEHIGVDDFTEGVLWYERFLTSLPGSA